METLESALRAVAKVGGEDGRETAWLDAQDAAWKGAFLQHRAERIEARAAQ